MIPRAALISLALLAIPAAAAELELRGRGEAALPLLGPIYTATLHAPATIPAARILAVDTPRRLTIVYHRRIRAEQLVRTGEKTIARQLDPAEREPIRPGLASLHAAMEDVGPGDRYVLDYHPDRGLALRLNRRTLFFADAPRLAEAYFGIWLAPGGLSESLRRQLLGQGPRASAGPTPLHFP